MPEAERTMISLCLPASRFDYRVVGIFVHAGHVLLHRAEIDDFWAPPGGRCELGETSEQALVREMREEMGETVRVERLLWVVENFYTRDRVAHHGLGLYYLATLPYNSPRLDVTTPFEGDEEGLRLSFQWFPLASVGSLHLYPLFLRTALQTLPTPVRHIITREVAHDTP